VTAQSAPMKNNTIRDLRCRICMERFSAEFAVRGVLAIIATYDFLTLFLKKSFTRKLGVFLATLGGGGGWLLALLGRTDWLGSLPIDFYSPETFGFLGLYGIAHLPWARAFFLWGLRAYLVRGGKVEIPPPVIFPFANLPPGVLWLLTGLAQPLTGMLMGVIVIWHIVGLIGVHFGRNLRGEDRDWKTVELYFKTALLAGLIALPLVLYNYFAFMWDPFIRQWMGQNPLPAPHPFHYLLAYGLLFPFVLVGIRQILFARQYLSFFLIGWIALLPIMLVISFGLQRRLVEGMWVALVAMALVAYEEIPDLVFRRTYAILVFTLPTTFFLLAGGLNVAANPAAPIFRPQDEIAAFKFLAQYATPDDAVLSSFHTGNALPAWVPVFVVVGHGPETVGAKEIEPRVKSFYTVSTSDQDRLKLLEEFGVDYVFWGPSERELGAWHPTAATYLSQVYAQGEYAVFAVEE